MRDAACTSHASDLDLYMYVAYMPEEFGHFRSGT